MVLDNVQRIHLSYLKMPILKRFEILFKILAFSSAIVISRESATENKLPIRFLIGKGEKEW